MKNALMKKDERIILHREALYNEVWETPILQLAKKYGMSDVGLAKICRRMQIPLPPRGYWAKSAHGHKVRKRSLSPLESNGLTEVIIDKSAEELLRIARKRHINSQRLHRENQRIHRLKREMEGWEMSQRVRAYVVAMRSSDHDLDDEFFAWAETYADHLDPAVDFRITLLDEA